MKVLHQLQYQITSSILYSKMNIGQAQTLKYLLRQKQLPLLTLDHFISNLERDPEIQKFVLVVAELLKTLSKKQQPYVRVNSVKIAYKLLNLGNYCYLLLAEIYLMPEIQKVVQFVTSKPGIHHIAQYFSLQGQYSNISYIQNLSYNFVTTCCDFIKVAAAIKPLKVYQGREYSDSSNFQKSWQRLQKRSVKEDYQVKIYKAKDEQPIRQKYVYSLSKWSDYEESLVDFYIRILEQNLREEPEHMKYPLNFTEILKYGQPGITSQTIARLVEIITSSYNFKIRTRALRMLDSLILWGDVEALLVVNFTEHIQLIVRNILRVNGQASLEQGSKIYPQIQGQQQEKLQFYAFFLRCIQTWAECYPNNDYFDYQNKMKKQQSVIKKLYQILKQTKQIKFPQNLIISRYQKQSHSNMNKNIIRNQMILIDILSQTSKDESEMNQAKTFEEVQKYYQQHKDYFLDILNGGANGLDQKMNKLLGFKQIFQHSVQSIEIFTGITQNIDLLIQNGLELIDLIESIHQPYLEYLKSQYNYQEFEQKINNICLKYYQCDEQSQSEGPFRRFLSQKLKTKRNELSFMKLKSIPAENQLKLIVNNLNIKQLRAKYKKKMQKAQGNRSSQGSGLSLQIFTRTRFSKDSADKNQKEKRDISTLLQNSLKKDISEKLNKVEPLSDKNQKVSDSKLNKKRLNVISISKKSESFEKKSRENKPLPPSFRLLPQNVKQSEAQAQTINKEQLYKFNEQLYKFKIGLNENQQYYQYFNDQIFKYSYLLGHIVIYNSDQMSVERVVCQIIEDNQIKVKIYIIVIPRCNLNNFKYIVQDQGSIEISDRTKLMPNKMVPQMRYVIEVVGQMKKIPLKLPNIALFIEGCLILNYVLPFTINFFLDCYSNQTQVVTSFRVFQTSLHYQFVSQRFKSSNFLFPDGNTDNIFIFFPFLLKLTKVNDPKELYLWEVKYNKIKFLIVIEYNLNMKEMIVKLKSSIESAQPLLPLFKYLVNWLVKLLGVFGSNKL